MTFCTTSIKGITFFEISKDDMVSVRERQKERYQLGNTVEGMKSSHHFEPQFCSAIRAKHLSAENRFSINHSLSLPPEEAHEQSIWGLLVVSSGYGCHPDEKDFTCKFMHPHGHTENDYVTCQYGDYWWLALVMDVIQMRRTSLVSLCIHMATQRTTMSPVNMETTGG